MLSHMGQNSGPKGVSNRSHSAGVDISSHSLMIFVMRTIKVKTKVFFTELSLYKVSHYHDRVTKSLMKFLFVLR